MIGLMLAKKNFDRCRTTSFVRFAQTHLKGAVAWCHVHSPNKWEF